MSVLKNNRGQSLVEYLIIVSLVGVSAIVLIRAVGQNVNVQFARIVKSLGGEVQGTAKASAVTEGMYQKKDLKNFIRGAVESKSKGSGDQEND